MSFLPPLDDEREALATLEDALAFIDACEQQQTQERKAVEHTQQSECNFRNSSRTTKKQAHRERVKAELQQLRHEAAALELWLTRMKMDRIYPGSADTGNPANVEHSIVARSSHLMATSSHWMVVLVREFQHRKLSETRNHKLKALLKRLAKAARSPDQALANRLTQEEITLISKPAESVAQPTIQAGDERESLVDRLHHLELNLKALLERSGLVDEESCMFLSQHKVDQTLGPVFECASSTPLSHSVMDTDSVVMAFQKDADKIATASVKTDASRTSYKVGFQIDGQQYETRGVLQKRTEVSQIVYVWSSVSRLADNVILKEEGFTRIFRPTPPHSASMESMSAVSQLQAWRMAYMTQAATPLTGVASTMSGAGKMFRVHNNKIASFMQEFTESLQFETKDETIERVRGLCSVF